MNTANAKNRKIERNRKALKKLLKYAGIVVGGVVGVLLAYKIFEYLFTLVIVLIGGIGPLGHR